MIYSLQSFLISAKLIGLRVMSVGSRLNYDKSKRILAKISIKQATLFFSFGLIPMLIGQEVEWSSTSNSMTNVRVEEIASDRTGNTYMTGYYTDTLIITTDGMVDSVFSETGSKEIYIESKNEYGELRWAKSISCIGGDYPGGITVDKDDNVFFTGVFNNDISFYLIDDTIEVIHPESSASFYTYILKIDSLGNYLDVAIFGQIGSIWSDAIRTDSYGNIYVTGYFRDSSNFNLFGESIWLSTEYKTSYIAKLTNNCELLWVKKIHGVGGAGVSEGTAIEVDHENNVIVAGHFKGTFDFDPGIGSYELSSGGTSLYFLKLDPSGSLIWVKSIIEPYETALNRCAEIAVDSENNVYFMGQYNETLDFDVGDTEYLLIADEMAGFILKLNSAGEFQWVYNLDAEMDQRLTTIKIDQYDRLYASGRTANIDLDFDPSEFGYYPEVDPEVSSYYFLLKLNSDRKFLWLSTYYSPHYGSTHSLDIDDALNIYISGIFSGSLEYYNESDEIVSINGLNLGDVYTLKFNQCSGFGEDIDVSQIDNMLIVDSGYTYQWYQCIDGALLEMTGDTNAIYFPSSTGSYTVRIEDSTCTFLSDCIPFGFSHVLDESNSLFRAYPNPFGQTLTIDITDKFIGAYSIVISDQIGKKVFERHELNSTSYEIPLNGLSRGTYLITIISSDQKFSRTIKLISLGY